MSKKLMQGAYSAPEVRNLHVMCEAGFAVSGGFAGGDVTEENGAWD